MTRVLNFFLAWGLDAGSNLVIEKAIISILYKYPAFLYIEQKASLITVVFLRQYWAEIPVIAVNQHVTNFDRSTFEES